MQTWPASAEALCECQRRLSGLNPPAWRPPARASAVGGCFICFAREAPAPAGEERAWAGAATVRDSLLAARAVVHGTVRTPYEPGLLALREGPLLEAAVAGLARTPDVLLVNATGSDHPRRAGLALHLGAVLELASVGVTHRPLLARGAWPAAHRGARSPLRLDGETVACWLRTRSGARPLAVHPGWRTDLDVACEVVLAATRRVRAPEPLREARTAARRARAAAQG
jgi:deoxyribonuclease V